MNQRILFIVVLLSISTLSWGQDNYNYYGSSGSQSSTVPEESRFEIVQSELDFKTVLKVDKYTGYVYLLEENKEGMWWQLLSSEIHPDNEIIPDQVNFQISISGLQYWTFLININSGITWRLIKDRKTGFLWTIVE